MFVRREFTCGSLQCVLKVQRTKGSVRKWCRLFEEDGTNVRDKERTQAREEFNWEIVTFRTLHQVTVTRFSTSKYLLPTRIEGFTKR